MKKYIVLIIFWASICNSEGRIDQHTGLQDTNIYTEEQTGLDEDNPSYQNNDTRLFIQTDNGKVLVKSTLDTRTDKGVFQIDEFNDQIQEHLSTESDPINTYKIQRIHDSDSNTEEARIDVQQFMKDKDYEQYKQIMEMQNNVQPSQAPDTESKEPDIATESGKNEMLTE